jgi:molybdopterin/thiamine biosynthesis adenylyltransferase
MITLVFPDQDLDRLRTEMWDAGLESAAILLCTAVKVSPQSDWRLIVREMHVAPADAYEERTAISARLTAEYGLPFERKARQNNWSLVYCHTHPHQMAPACFSPVDDAAEGPLAAYAASRSPRVPHCAFVFAEGDLASRRLGTQEGVRVIQVGQSITNNAGCSVGKSSEQFDRQIRAFGAQGQEQIRATRVGIVGLGGTGSLIAQSLAHLGVERFVLIDRDKIEVTNLNRTVGSGPHDVGAAKVEVAERLIGHINPAAQVQAVVADIVDSDCARLLLGVDVIFSCTDSHASRHLINQLAHQYVIPAIDMGVAIHARPDEGVQFAGHVKALAPGLSCLWCLNTLDPQEVRRELMNAEQRAADPYFSGDAGVPQPAVISVNSTVTSLAVTMFLSMVAGLDAPARYLVYDGNRQRVAAVLTEPMANCNFCGIDSAARMGDEAPLPTRIHAPR